MVAGAENLDSALVRDTYASATHRLLFFDYDGTLSPFHVDPAKALPSQQILDWLDILAKNPKNIVYIISGRPPEFLTANFGHLDVGLAGEHGFFFRYPPARRPEGDNSDHRSFSGDISRASSTNGYTNGISDSNNGNIEGFAGLLPEGWQVVAPKTDLSWKQELLPEFTQRAKQVPGSLVEEKNAALCWHYRDAADRALAEQHAAQLIEHLKTVLSSSPAEVLNGNKVVEVRARGVHKGAIVDRVIQECSKQLHDGRAIDFVLCVGDDKTDEDMFTTLSSASSGTLSSTLRNIVTCTIGVKPDTQARYFLASQGEVPSLVGMLADLSAG